MISQPLSAKAQQSHLNFFHCFWALGQGVLTFDNTHVCAKLTQLQLVLLITVVHGHEAKLMSTDLTAAVR